MRNCEAAVDAVRTKNFVIARGNPFVQSIARFGERSKYVALMIGRRAASPSN